ncbi:single-stranded-DNA-specific exonuclease RecJ [Desulfatiferula olefinivorans]
MKDSWTLTETDADLVSEIALKTGLSPVLSNILVQRGFDTPEAVKAFLTPSLGALRSPFLMKGMDRAVERIIAAIDRHEKILIFGDYDVDGITGTALLYNFLNDAGADVTYYIPHRIREGYSFKAHHVPSVLVPRKINLVITVDCGSDSKKAVSDARAQGIDVVITDHHSVPDTPPAAFCMVNPKQSDCPSGLSHLAGVGVVFYLLMALRKTLRDKAFWTDRPEPDLKTACDLVALGTIADIVPLVSENRILTRHGLSIINRAPKTGIKALIDTSKINKPLLTTEDIAFKIAPRLNAAGRIEHADLAFGLLSATSMQEAKQRALSLDRLNSKRQSIEQQILDEIERHLTDHPHVLEQAALVLHRQGWHLGVLGIVAARLCRRYDKPVVLISLEGDSGKGSGRSVSGVDLYEALAACEPFLEGFGGHSMAAGLEIRTANLSEFQRTFNRHVKGLGPQISENLRLSINSRIDFDDICPELIDHLEKMEPFGSHNPEPLFLTDDISVVSSTPVGTRHRRLIVRSAAGRTDTSLMAMHFNIDPKVPCPSHFRHLVFRLQWNRWNNAKSAQLIIEDYL